VSLNWLYIAGIIVNYFVKTMFFSDIKIT